MTYATFDPATPDVSIDTRKEAIDNTRSNLTALADMMAAFAGMQGFDLSIISSTSDGPTELNAVNGTQIVKKVITYGSGVTAGLPVTIVYSKSVNSGGAYDSIATQTLSYDGSGNFLSYAWS